MSKITFTLRDDGEWPLLVYTYHVNFSEWFFRTIPVADARHVTAPTKDTLAWEFKPEHLEALKRLAKECEFTNIEVVGENKTVEMVNVPEISELEKAPVKQVKPKDWDYSNETLALF